MHNKTLYQLNTLPRDGQNVLLADEDSPCFRGEDYELKWCMFVRVGIQDGEFKRCKFHQCIFEDCYFRKAKFENVDLTGSCFRDCNLERATFKSSDLRYVRFVRCLLDYNEILAGLPGEPGIAVRLLRSLRENAIEMGEKQMADKLLDKEIEVEKAEWWNIVKGASHHYRERYDVIARGEYFVKWVGSTLSGLILGHGLRVSKIMMSGLCLVLLCAVLMWTCDGFLTSSGERGLSYMEALYLSAVTFTTLGYGDFTPNSNWGFVLCSVESLLGIVFWGFLTASVYRKYSR